MADPKPKPTAQRTRDEVEEFYRQYLRSPNYRKRLINQGYTDPSGVIKQRTKRLDTDKFIVRDSAGSEYLNSTNAVIYDPVEVRKYNLSMPGTISHEYSHLVGSDTRNTPNPFGTLNARETGEIDRRNKAFKNWPEHDARAWEAKADIDALRFLLKKDKLYDTGTQTFDTKTLQEAKKRYGSQTDMKRLFGNFNDQDLIHLMNNIAYQQQGSSSTAENGKYMKINPKYLEYSKLPSAKRKKANSGMYMDPGPRYPMPQMGGAVADYYQGDSPVDMQPTMPTRAPIGSIDTGLVQPGRGLTAEDLQPVSQRSRPVNWGDAALYGLAAVDALIPGARRRQQVVEPQRTYNPYPYGTGSQALEYGGYLQEAKDGKWIQKAINPEHKGYCTPMTKSTCTPKRKALAKTLKKMAKNRKKEGGGIIPDPMSPFNPHEYASGGNVNGGANIKMVGSGYPNPDLLEQWLLYRQGGNINGGAQVREVDAMYPNTDLMEQWLLYKNGGTLSASKAKEMLRDGTANGKKLTKKQKRYFGMVAAGKAVAGDMLAGDPVKPLQRPIKDEERFANSSADLAGTSSFTDNQFAMGYQDKRMAKGIDLINSIVASGLLPNQTDRGKAAATTLDPTMLNYLYQFNQRGDVRGMTPDQRVQAFYNIPSNNPNIQSMKDNMKRYGYGPMEFRRGQTVSDAVPIEQVASTMRNGGVMYNDGGMVDTMWGGNAELESYNPYDGGTIAFDGSSHDNGGIGMSYNGTPVEVEGGEFASRDLEGNLSIYGNMYIPGTRTKFKSAAKKMAEKENRYDALRTRGADLVESANPADKWDQLVFNAGRVMMEGGTMGQVDMAAKKSRLSALQRAMLNTASEFGLDPQRLSEGKMRKAKGGASIPFYQNGGDPKPTVADRNNNPGNIKWSDFARKQGAKKGPPAPDGGFWAIFPSRDKGLSAMKNLLKSDSYRNLDVDTAISRWTGGHPYRYDLSSLRGKKVGDLSNNELQSMLDTMVKGEGTTYGMTPRVPARTTPTVPTPAVRDPGPFTPYTIPGTSLTPEMPDPIPGTVEPPPITGLTVPPDVIPPSNVEPLHANQLMGEIYAAATNKVEPVPVQRYEPQLYNPYQISLQDRLNANQATFNAQARAVGASNPSALGTLAGQKYAADSAVKADEFRTNQAIASDITNKNIALINDTQLKNLALADQQMVRQSEARSRTRALTQATINSAASKYAQNELENRRLAVYENLYDYRFVPTEDGGQRAQYFGPNAMFNFGGGQQAGAQDVRTVSRYDRYGNLRGYTQYDDYDLREQERQLDLKRKQRELPLMQVPKLQ